MMLISMLTGQRQGSNHILTCNSSHSSNCASSFLASAKRMLSAASTMYTTPSADPKYSPHKRRAELCPPRSYVVITKLPICPNTFVAMRMIYNSEVACCNTNKPSKLLNLGATWAGEPRCENPSALRAAWSFLHCQDQETEPFPLFCAGPGSPTDL